MCVCFKMKKKKKIPSIFWILHIKKWKNLKASSVDVVSFTELIWIKCFEKLLMSIYKLCGFVIAYWHQHFFLSFLFPLFLFQFFFFTVYGNIHGKVAYGRELHVVMMYVTYILICSVVIEFNGCMCFLFMV